MKKKIISLFLAFFIFISSSLSCYAEDKNVRFVDGGTISLPMLATVATLAVGAGIVISDNDDLYNIGYQFYKHNKERMEVVNAIFKSSVTYVAGQAVKVGSEFIEECKNFFDSLFSSSVNDTITGSSFDFRTKSFPISFSMCSKGGIFPTGLNVKFYESSSDLGTNNYYEGYLSIVCSFGNYGKVGYKVGEVFTGNRVFSYSYFPVNAYMSASSSYPGYYSLYVSGGTSLGLISIVGDTSIGVASYNWDNVKDKVDEEKGSMSLPVPGDLSNLVGQTSSGVFNPTYDLTDGAISIPSVENPSISVTDDSFVSEGAGAGEVSGTGNITFPSFGDSIDFSPFELSGITEKFPFSLPWDIGRLIKSFDVTPKAPVFDVPIFSEKITVDLTQFDEWANIVRWFITISLITTLIYISVRLKG